MEVKILPTGMHANLWSGTVCSISGIRKLPQ